MRRLGKLGVAVLFALFSAGCLSFDDFEATGRDSGLPDGGAADGRVQDASVPDGSVGDGGRDGGI